MTSKNVTNTPNVPKTVPEERNGHMTRRDQVRALLEDFEPFRTGLGDKLEEIQRDRQQ